MDGVVTGVVTVVAVVTQEQIDSLGAVAERLDARGLDDESRVLRDVLARLERPPREVRASTAASILAVTPQTVRNWVRGGILPGRRNRTGHFYVRLDALEPSLAMRRVLPDEPAGPVADEEIEAARAERRSRRARAASVR
jgi:hypothetical protein